MSFVLVIILHGLFLSSITFANSLTSSDLSLPISKSYETYQGFDGTCYAHVAANFLNTTSESVERLRIRPKSSLAVLSLNESSPFLQSQVVSKYFLGESVYDGGWYDQLLENYYSNLESLIPISEKLEWHLSSAIPFYLKPKSIDDTARIRSIVSKNFYNKIQKALKSTNLKNEAQDYVLEMQKMGLFMDDYQKKMTYIKPDSIRLNEIQEKLKDKKFNMIFTKNIRSNPDSCMSDTQDYIYKSLDYGLPVPFSMKMNGVYHAMLIYKITQENNDAEIFLKNSWKNQPFIKFKLSELCKNKKYITIGLSWGLFHN